MGGDHAKDTTFLDTTLFTAEDTRLGHACDRPQRERMLELVRRFGAFVGKSHYGYLEVDADGCIRAVNLRTLQMLGYEADEVLGQEVTSFIVEEQRKGAADMLKVALTDPPTNPRQYHARCKDGSAILLSVYSVLLGDPGHAPRLLYLLLDVTNQQAVRLTLRSIQTTLSCLLEHMPDTMLILDEQGTVRYINRVIPEASLSDVIGTDGLHYVAPEWCEVARQTPREALRTGQIRHYEVRDIYGNWWFCRAVPLDSEDDQQHYVMVIATDVTQLKQSEAALRESEQRYRLIVENVTDLVWMGRVAGLPDEPETGDGSRQSLDLDALLARWEWTFLSPSVESIFGYSVDQGMKTRLRDILVPSSYVLLKERIRDELMRAPHRMLATHDPITLELEHIACGGRSVWCEVTARPLVDECGRVYGAEGVTRDITERRNIERELSQSFLRQQQQMARQLHDNLGQDLLGLRLIAENLHRQLASEKMEEKKLADEIVHMAMEAQHHVRQIIKGARPVEVDSTGLMNALRELAESMSRMSGIPCHFQCDLPVYVENSHTATQLFLVAQEAVRNAIKHASPQNVTIGLTRNDYRTAMWVTDDGRGIKMSSSSESGTGLRIMRYRASLIGASLSIGPADGGGTIVTCVLAHAARGNHP